ncbi:hypothetical protein MRX96_025310 [Rhipicephalus microplus]
MVSGDTVPSMASCRLSDTLASTFCTVEAASYSNGSANICRDTAQTCIDRENGLRNLESIRVAWKNLSYAVKTGKRLKSLVDNLSGEALPGTLTAIMGPSGAGKTTLLNLLTGFYDKGYKGEVQINGCVRDQSLFNKQSCYVMQDDRLLPALTVYEAISMSVQLRMPTSSPTAKEEMVQRSIAEWGLHECRNTRTESLSGGERKRLAIAQELVNNPPVLFLDEPTSGLDNVSSLMCVQVLKTMASSGHTVICSIHAPSAKIFSYFDSLYMMSGGRCIYNGRVDLLLPFLAQRGLPCPEYHNPADYMSELASDEHSDYCERLSTEFRIPLPCAERGFDDHSQITAYGGKVMTEQERAEQHRMYSFEVNQFQQFRTLLRRCWLSIVRNKVATVLRVLVYAAFAVMSIVLFYDTGNRASTVVHSVKLYFIVVCICVVQTVFPSTLVFPAEVSVLVREQRNCWYGLKAYCLAYYIAELPFLVLPITLYMGAIYYPTAQPQELWRFAAMLLFTIQLCGVSQAIALATSALCTAQRQQVAFPIVSPAFMFCSAFAPRQMLTPYVGWLTEVSFVNHAYNGLLLSAYGYGRAKFPCSDFICVYEDPAELLQSAGVADRTIHEFYLILLAMEVVIRIVGFFLLRFRLSRKN